MSQATRRSVLAAVTAAALATTGAVTAVSAAAAPTDRNAREARPAFTLSVAHNNDGESSVVPQTGIDGNSYAGVARFDSVVDRLEREALRGRPAPGQSPRRGFLLLNSGDNFLAGAAFNAGQEEGAPFYDAVAIDYLDYDALAIGNHEFDFGPDTLADFIEAVGDTPFVTANLDFSTEPALAALAEDGSVVASTVVRERGERIGIIGLTTPELRSISSPGDIGIDPDLVTVTQAQVDALTAEGVDIIILQSHLQGIAAESALVTELSGVDAVIGGGGADLLAAPDDLLIPGDVAVGTYPLVSTDTDGVEVPVVTTSGNYRYVGQLVLNFDREGVVTSYDEDRSGLNRVSSVGPDAVEPDQFLLENVEEPVGAYLDALDANVLADNQVNLDLQTTDVRGGESNGGNLMADMMFAAADKRAATFGVPAPDLALHNGGGIRGNIDQPVGPFSEADTFRIAAFSNFVSIAPEMTPLTLKAILEEGVASLPGNPGDGAFAQISGASYVVDTTQQARVNAGEAGDFAEVTPGQRIRSIVLDDGTVIVEDGEIVFEGTLSVASNDFSLAGGDAYPPSEFVRLGVQYQQALAQYLTDDLGGVVTAAQYPVGGEGRILIDP